VGRADLLSLQRALGAAATSADMTAEARVAAATLEAYVGRFRAELGPPATQPATDPLDRINKENAARMKLPLPPFPPPTTRPWYDCSPAFFKPSLFVADPLPAEQQALLQPSLVTLHVTDAAPREVFEKVGRQTGVRFDPIVPDYWQRGRSAPITLNVDRQPLWSVLLDLMSQTHLVLRPHDRESIWLVMGNPDLSGRPLVRGPFLIVAAHNITDFSRPYSSPGLQDLQLLRRMAIGRGHR
jgi:hypothetical protein